MIFMGMPGNNTVEAAFRAVERIERRPRRRQPAALAALPICARWMVGRVKTGCELAVAADLTASGLAYGYAPVRLIWVDHGRVNGSNARRQAGFHARALIPGYVFIGCAAGVYVRKGAHVALIDVVGDQLGRPGVSQAAMDDLSTLQAALAMRERARREGFKLGELVETQLAGVRILGVVKALRAAGVVVEARIFGGLNEITVPVDTLAKAD